MQEFYRACDDALVQNVDETNLLFFAVSDADVVPSMN